MFSSVVALGLLILSTDSSIWLLIISFIALLILDYALYQAQIINAKYFSIRKYVTLSVVIALIVVVWQV